MNTILRQCWRSGNRPATLLQQPGSTGLGGCFVSATIAKSAFQLSVRQQSPHRYNPLQIITRCMSKYVSKSMKKNLPLTTKRAHKGFYKGKGGTSEGRLNSKGRFIVNPLKRLELVVPDLTAFRLKPYIASSASRFPPEQRHNPVSI
jgi:large subunit ribosomal protein L41